MFFKRKNLATIRVDSNTLRTILAYGEELMTVLVQFEKGLDSETLIPLHHHRQAQATYILKGSFKFSAQCSEHTDTQVVFAGDAIYFPKDTPHGCIPLEDDSQLIDSFTPIRDDFFESEQ